jgi:hypothetical protein
MALSCSDRVSGNGVSVSSQRMPVMTPRPPATSVVCAIARFQDAAKTGRDLDLAAGARG